MLTPMLQKIKDRIEKKSSYLRSTEEGDLLKELNFLDNNSTIHREFSEFERKIVSGPSNQCPCCGKY